MLISWQKLNQLLIIPAIVKSLPSFLYITIIIIIIKRKHTLSLCFQSKWLSQSLSTVSPHICLQSHGWAVVRGRMDQGCERTDWLPGHGVCVWVGPFGRLPANGYARRGWSFTSFPLVVALSAPHPVLLPSVSVSALKAAVTLSCSSATASQYACEDATSVLQWMHAHRYWMNMEKKQQLRHAFISSFQT